MNISVRIVLVILGIMFLLPLAVRVGWQMHGLPAFPAWSHPAAGTAKDAETAVVHQGTFGAAIVATARCTKSPYVSEPHRLTLFDCTVTYTSATANQENSPQWCVEDESGSEMLAAPAACADNPHAVLR